MPVSFVWRGAYASPEVDALHAAAFGHEPSGDDWLALVERHSLGWVIARDGRRLIGFVNVVWDGGVHAWLQDLMVASGRRRSGVGTRLVAAAVEGARAAGCEWAHADFDDELAAFYFEACGFTPTCAGLLALR